MKNRTRRDWGLGVGDWAAGARRLHSVLYLCLTALLLAGCGGLGISAESQATQTAQAERNIRQATRQAEMLQETDQVKLAGVTQTHQANRRLTAQAELDQQATLDAKAATEQAYKAQRTAEALEIQRLIEIARSWPALVADAFDQPAYNWPVESETFPSGKVSWQVANGKYIWNASAERGYTYWNYPTRQPVGDFYLAVEVQHTGGVSDSEAGLVFHTNEQNYWCYLISGEGDLFVGLRVNGEWRLSWPLGSSHVRRSGPNLLAVINQGNYHIFLINGFNFMSIGNDALPTGPAGLMISLWNPGEQATWEFDNFELRTPGTPAPGGGE